MFLVFKTSTRIQKNNLISSPQEVVNIWSTIFDWTFFDHLTSYNTIGDNHLWVQTHSQKGPNKTANWVIVRTKYEHKLYYKGDQIWVLTQLQKVLNMAANFDFKGTKYECKHWKVPLDEIRREMRVRKSRCEFVLIFSAYWKCSHSYLVLFRIKFALIFSSYYDPVCSLIWSLLWMSLHS